MASRHDQTIANPHMPPPLLPSLPPPPQPLSVHGQAWALRRLGQGPRLLLLHGTGASAASWWPVARCLAPRFEILMPDLPGHGESAGFADHRASLPRMGAALAALLRALDWRPQWMAGHSAGAAVMLQLQLAESAEAEGLLAVNAALRPLPGLAGQLFPPLARWLARQDWLQRQAAARAAQAPALQRLLASTGSRLDAQGQAQYQALLSKPAHVRGALDMMAHWDLEPLRPLLPKLRQPLWLLAGNADATVAPQQSERLAAELPGARYLPLEGLGHLAHEEAPARVASLIEALVAFTQARARTAADTACGEPGGRAR